MSGPLFTDTVTVYNHYRENRADFWQRTVLRGVQWRQKVVQSSDSAGSIVLSTETSVTIPAGVDAGERAYAAPSDFQTAEDRSSFWTLNPASGDDFLLPGEHTEELTDSMTADELLALGGVVIRAVRDNTIRPLLRTWKVTAI